MGEHPELGASTVSISANPNAQRPQQDLLRVMTCGSVDDGKSTLIGRLLYDSGVVPLDELATLEADSAKSTSVNGQLDFSLLLDGLISEREQKITVDIAYRYFATPQRKFILADSPGHEQYTRNMVTAASVSDLAIVLADVRNGVLIQTRRHTSIIGLLGIRNIMLAINKMDLVNFSQQHFEAVAQEYESFAQQLGLTKITCIPLSALSGENVVHKSYLMPWYSGPSLMAHLETIDLGENTIEGPLRFPVQLVARPDADFRGYAGSLVRGAVRLGSQVTVLPSGRPNSVKRIIKDMSDVQVAATGDAVTLVLNDEIDISRGDVIVGQQDPAQVTDQLAAHLIWMGDEPMLPGRPYIIRCGTQTGTATITSLRHRMDVNTLGHVADRSLAVNEIGFCNLSISRPLVFDPYEIDRAMGSFILIDRIKKATVGAGLIRFALRRASNLHWQELAIDKAARAAAKLQKPYCLWFTGLSGSGKSTVADLLERQLHARGRHTYILDGDNVRHGLNRDLGFTDADRVENIRRVAEAARLMVDAGLIVMVSFISPFREERQLARERFADGEFFEIFLDTPLATCEERDPKGLYRKARQGILTNFTGIDSAYEPPDNPDLVLPGGRETPEQLTDRVMQLLRRRHLE